MDNRKNAENEALCQHSTIKVEKFKFDPAQSFTNKNQLAAWFPSAGLGLFIHWGISTVKATLDLSWGMICGWEFVSKKATEDELSEMNRPCAERTIGKKFTPNKYFALAKDFKGENFDADYIIRKAKEAGFTYAVFTTRHHDGFALWPSKYGSFSTKNYLSGRDFVREFAEACRKYGLKVGFYYSPPDWYFNRKYMSYLVSTAKITNPGLPELDADYNPTVLPDDDETEKQNCIYEKYVAGQIEELLTEYGKVDLLWFDGSMPKGHIYPMEKIRKLQPGIVINHRLHGTGDFDTCEVKAAESRPAGWWEFCTQWQSKGWAYMDGVPYRPISAISAEYVRTIAWGGNYLLNIGPMSDGTLSSETEEKLAEFTAWHSINKAAFSNTAPLDGSESCNYPAAKSNGNIYIYITAEIENEVVLSTEKNVVSATMLDDKEEVPTEKKGNEVHFSRPALSENGAVRIISVKLK